MHLWNHVSMPPAQNSLIIYTDGEVIEGNNFAAWEINREDVHRFISGGTSVRQGDLDEFSDASLLATGKYHYGFPHEVDYYTPEYPADDTYPQEATP